MCFDCDGIEVCESCKGTGRIPGVASELFQSHPITRVVLTDVVEHVPNLNVESLGMWRIKYDMETAVRKILRESGLNWGDTFMRHYTSEAAALDALSDAAVAYGRELAGLPALEAKR